MKRIALSLASLLLVGVLAPANAGAPKPLWEDAAGDADNSQGLDQSLPGGFDLVSGHVLRKGKDLEFTVFMADMPPVGSIPETFRFLWAFSVDNKVSYRITAKTADVGKPDVLGGETDERVGNVDPTGHFRLEGDCKAGETVGVLQPINCKPLEYVEGAFDPANSSLTVVIPMKLIKAKAGSLIGPGAGDATAICSAAACWVSHAAERSHSDTLIDVAFQTKSYKIK